MDDDLDSIIDMMNDGQVQKYQPARLGGIVLERPGQPKMQNGIDPKISSQQKNFMNGLPPLIQRKNSGSRMKLQYDDGKA